VKILPVGAWHINRQARYVYDTVYVEDETRSKKEKPQCSP